MQSAIPKGVTVLTRLRAPFHLDFNRNRIFIADWPGGSSPPPGMPFYQGGEKLADYLLDQSIRYVAYSYKSEGGFPKKIFEHRLSGRQGVWLRTEAEHSFNFHRNLSELGRSRVRIYDDGEIFILDLKAMS